MTSRPAARGARTADRGGNTPVLGNEIVLDSRLSC